MDRGRDTGDYVPALSSDAMSTLLVSDEAIIVYSWMGMFISTVHLCSFMKDKCLRKYENFKPIGTKTLQQYM